MTNREFSIMQENDINKQIKDLKCGGGRNSGIDLLRSIAMFMVVVLHVLNYGVEYESLPPFSINWGIAWFLEGASITNIK